MSTSATVGWYAWAFQSGASLGTAIGERGLAKMQRAHNEAVASFENQARQSQNRVRYANADLARDLSVENLRRQAMAGESQMDALNLNIARENRSRTTGDMAAALQRSEETGRAAAVQAAGDSRSSATAAVNSAINIKQGMARAEEQVQNEEAQYDQDQARKNLRRSLVWQQRSVSEYPDLDFGRDLAKPVEVQSWAQLGLGWVAGTNWQQGATLYEGSKAEKQGQQHTLPTINVRS